MISAQDEEIEAEARALLRDAIERSGWYPDLHGERRQQRIDRDVDLHWHLMLSEACERLDHGIRHQRK
jgi:hypothetical protein